ncbi:hypothetical protein CUMW_199300 [Citrus unshiu]|nr:hypothetical protein CUMW_199300 [Citrus unshiu]
MESCQICQICQMDTIDYLLRLGGIYLFGALDSAFCAQQTQVTELRRQGYQEVEKLCLVCLWSKNCSSGYKIGKKVFKTLQQLQGLTNEVDFKEVAQPVPENPVDERPLPPTVVGLQSTFDRVWRCLMEEQMGIVGLYGMGEVGKTTLLTQINNKFLHTPNDFDFVIWVAASKDLQLEQIQGSIAKKISHGIAEVFKRNLRK